MMINDIKKIKKIVIFLLKFMYFLFYPEIT